MKIPQETIDQILDATDIIELISEVVPLKKAGVNFKGLCPFHSEKTPSFVVSPSKRIFHCFGCHEGGDAFGFLMKTENLSFIEAVRVLAERANITIAWQGDEEAKKDPQKIYHKINAYAQWIFQQELQKSRPAQDYMKERGFSAEIAAKFELGYAPESYETLQRFFAEKKIPLEKAVDLGLIKKSTQHLGSYYDFFRHRLMFPIRSQKGDLIGFGGRSLAKDSKEAKYINSAESPIYHKTFELYGFYQNKREIIRHKQVILVEGYTDVIACVELGLPLAVAPLGTSFTTPQFTLIKRYVDDIIIMFDGDAAGQEAALRACDLCFAGGCHPRLALVPEGQDPGDLLKQGAREELKNIVNSSGYAMDWIFARFAKQAGASTSAKAKAAKSLLTWIDKLPERVERLAFHKKVEQYFGIPMPATKKVVENRREFVSSRPPKRETVTLEELLILALLQNPQKFQELGMGSLKDFFEKGPWQGLFSFFEKLLKKQETFTDLPSIRQVPEEDQQQYTRILALADEYPHLQPEDLITQLRIQFRKKRLQEITTAILQAEAENNSAEQMKLLQEKQKLLRQEL